MSDDTTPDTQHDAQDDEDAPQRLQEKVSRPDGDPEDGGPVTDSETPTEEPDEEEGPEWPVERGKDLTVSHIPQQLKDELLRPIRAQMKALGQAYADAMDSRNDLLNGVSQQVKMANKESQRMNAVHVQKPEVQKALVTAGVVDSPEQAPTAKGVDADD